MVKCVAESHISERYKRVCRSARFEKLTQAFIIIELLESAAMSYFLEVDLHVPKGLRCFKVQSICHRASHTVCAGSFCCLVCLSCSVAALPCSFLAIIVPDDFFASVSASEGKPGIALYVCDILIADSAADDANAPEI